MANVTVAEYNVFEPETAVVKAAAQAASAADVLVLPDSTGVLCVVNAGAATVLTIAAGGTSFGAPALVIDVAASKTAFIPIEDTSAYVQSDGTVHIATSAALTDVYLITR